MGHRQTLTMLPFAAAAWGGAAVVASRHPGNSQAVLETMAATASPLILWFWVHLRLYAGSDGRSG